MALFDKRTPEQKEQEKQEKLNEALRKVGLDNASADVRSQVADILTVDLAGTGLVEAGSFLTGNKTNDNTYLMKTYTVALMHQNWIIIKLLDEIRNK